MRASIVVALAVSVVITASGCSTPVTAETQMRLAVATPYDRVMPVKGPFVSQYFPNGDSPIWIHPDPHAEPLTPQEVESISREIQNGVEGFVAGYQAGIEGGNPWDDAPPDEVEHRETWGSAFYQGVRMAERYTSSERHRERRGS